MKLEVVMLPVRDVDVSIAFYRDRVGFNLDHDVQPGNGMRVVQLTPPGSACSVVFGEGMGGLAEPGSVRNLHLVVKEIESVKKDLDSQGVATSDVHDMGDVKYVYFSDPDGNTWALQEIDRSSRPA